MPESLSCWWYESGHNQGRGGRSPALTSALEKASEEWGKDSCQISARAALRKNDFGRKSVLLSQAGISEKDCIANLRKNHS